jgi:hypothetical protein
MTPTTWLATTARTLVLASKVGWKLSQLFTDQLTVPSSLLPLLNGSLARIKISWPTSTR